jgi:glycosyltransferase involved in cell wall biosynthesis
MTIPLPEISLVIPAYNEQELIASALDTLVKFLASRYPQFEILVVDDGSLDQTVQVAQQFRAKQPRVRVLDQPSNQGKGRAIQRGVRESRGKWILFMDADLPYELEAVDAILTALRNGSDLAIGSRHLEGSEIRDVPPLRYLAGQVFSFLVGLLMFPGIHDTQCGLKGFRAEPAQQIFKRLTIPKFGFDVEVLYIARKLKYSILPVPVRMTGFRYDSRIRVLRDSGRMFLDLFAIRWNDIRGKYD